MPRREYDKPLGPPQGLGKRGWTNPEGQYFSNVYTREFAHASVWVNVQTRNGIIHWRAPADTTAAKSDDVAAASVQPPPDISRYQIVLGSEATAGERYAAARLQSLLGRLRANLSLPIVPQAAGCCQLAVGAAAATSLLPSLRPSLPQLGDEGFALATHQASWSVAITGADGSQRGVLYGVHRFLELLGYDFLSWDATNAPAARADVWPGPLWLT